MIKTPIKKKSKKSIIAMTTAQNTNIRSNKFTERISQCYACQKSKQKPIEIKLNKSSTNQLLKKQSAKFIRKKSLTLTTKPETKTSVKPFNESFRFKNKQQKKNVCKTQYKKSKSKLKEQFKYNIGTKKKKQKQIYSSNIKPNYEFIINESSVKLKQLKKKLRGQLNNQLEKQQILIQQTNRQQQFISELHRQQMLTLKDQVQYLKELIAKETSKRNELEKIVRVFTEQKNKSFQQSLNKSHIQEFNSSQSLLIQTHNKLLIKLQQYQQKQKQLMKQLIDSQAQKNYIKQNAQDILKILRQEHQQIFNPQSI